MLYSAGSAPHEQTQNVLLANRQLFPGSAPEQQNEWYVADVEKTMESVLQRITASFAQRCKDPVFIKNEETGTVVTDGSRRQQLKFDVTHATTERVFLPIGLVIGDTEIGATFHPYVIPDEQIHTLVDDTLKRLRAIA